jgi:hypothetical protein
MLPGQTFRIGTQEYAQPVLRTFMLLSVAGKCPTTNIQTPTTLGWGFFLCATAKPREHARTAE